MLNSMSKKFALIAVLLLCGAAASLGAGVISLQPQSITANIGDPIIYDVLLQTDLPLGAYLLQVELSSLDGASAVLSDYAVTENWSDNSPLNPPITNFNQEGNVITLQSSLIGGFADYVNGLKIGELAVVSDTVGILDLSITNKVFFTDGLQAPEGTDLEITASNPESVSIQAGPGVIGDANDNGRLDIGDALAISQALAGLISVVPNELAADFNGNGRVDIGDALGISQVLAGLIENPNNPAAKIAKINTKAAKRVIPLQVGDLVLALVIEDGLYGEGDTVVGRLVANVGASPLGAYDLTITYDAAALSVVSVETGSAAEFTRPTVNTQAAGVISMNEFQSASLDSPTGEVELALVTFQVQSPITQRSTLIDIEITDIFDTSFGVINLTPETAQVQLGSSVVPTESPTEAPPTEAPTLAPTETATEVPTLAPTLAPTETATEVPTVVPTETATEVPTVAPTETATEVPTVPPTLAPTETATEVPTVAPTETATEVPTVPPTLAPTETATEVPTVAPTETATEIPTVPPTLAPTETATEVPTVAPTETATEIPTLVPTETATEVPTVPPTLAPTETATEIPTLAPTETATEAPTVAPTLAPTETATEVPTEAPTVAPTETATEVPTVAPTLAPTETATEVPTEVPTEAPTVPPTETATEVPTEEPTETPTPEVTATPTSEITPTPTVEITPTPTTEPTSGPTPTVTATPPVVVPIGPDEGLMALSSAGFLMARGSETGREVEAPYPGEWVDLEMYYGLPVILTTNGEVYPEDARRDAAVEGETIVSAVDLEFVGAGDAYLILDRYGNIHAYGTAESKGSISDLAPNPFEQEIRFGRIVVTEIQPMAIDLEVVPDPNVSGAVLGYYIADMQGNLYNFGDVPVVDPVPDDFGAVVAVELITENGAVTGYHAMNYLGQIITWTSGVGFNTPTAPVLGHEKDTYVVDFVKIDDIFLILDEAGFIYGLDSAETFDPAAFDYLTGARYQYYDPELGVVATAP